MLYTLRHLLSLSTADSGVEETELLRRLQRVSELQAESVLSVVQSAAVESVTPSAAADRSLLGCASVWCLPQAAGESTGVVTFSGANSRAAAECVVGLAQHAADQQRALSLFIHSTTLDPISSIGWLGVTRSTTDAALSQLATRLQLFNATAGRSALHV